MNNQMLNFARVMVQSNRNRIPNTPWARAAVSAIMNGDAVSGSQIAENLCNSYGCSKEDVLKQAANFFTS